MIESVHGVVFGFDLCVCVYVFWCVASVLYPCVYPGIRSWSANPGSWRVSADVDCQAALFGSLVALPLAPNTAVAWPTEQSSVCVCMYACVWVYTCYILTSRILILLAK